jgi:hypothetical protein
LNFQFIEKYKKNIIIKKLLNNKKISNKIKEKIKKVDINE